MDWQKEYRKNFPVTDLCTYMDSAYDCGGSLIGKQAADRYFEDWAIAAATAAKGGPGRKPFFGVADETRDYLGRILGVAAKNVSITKNTNEGFNIIMQGFDFKPGDNVVTLDREYPSVIMPCLHIAENHGIECRLAQMNDTYTPSVDDLWEKVDERTVMVLVSHVQSKSGYKIDLRELGRRCRERGIFLIVDAIQSIGLNEFHTEEWGVSAVSGAGYKGLCAFISIGYLYCCDELLARIEPTYVSSSFQLGLDYSGDTPVIICKDPLNASKFDNSSSDFLGIYVLHDAVEAILEIGVDQIELHVTQLLDQLYDGLLELGFEIMTPNNRKKRCASLCIRTEHAAEINNFFMEHQIIFSVGQDTIRMSLGAYSNDDDVKRTLVVASQCPWR